jgi:hypothetical protein
MSEMRMIGKIAGLCLAAMCAMSMIAAGTASANWQVCLEAHSGTTSTKWETHQCEKAASGGAWEWSEPSTELAVKTHETLTLSSEELGVKVKVKCSGTDKGFIGPGGQDRTTEINVEKCEAGENCEKLEKKAEAVHLPWESEMLETEGKIHDAIRSDGNGEPGWRVACKVPLRGVVENECTSEEGLLVLENKNTPGVSGALLVLGEFTNKPKENCTATGKESGEVLGGIATSLENGQGFREDRGGFIVIRPKPYVYGKNLEKNRAYPKDFEVVNIGGGGAEEFKVISVKLNEETVFKIEPANTTCKAGTVLKPGGGPCEVQVVLTPNKEHGRYIVTLMVEIEEVKGKLVQIRTDRLEGEN